MAIKNDERALHSIYEDLKANRMVRPNFQRGFVWKIEKQKGFIASVLVDLPIGSLLILEGDTNDFSKRELCFPNELETTVVKNSCQYVLDGQQRLSTLRTVFYDIFSEKENWEHIWNDLYPPLRTRWFLRVKPKKDEEDEEDYFGYENLKFTSICNLTNNDIQSFIENKAIDKNKSKEIHHPGFTLAEENPSQHRIKNHIAENYANECIVPLYEIDKKSEGLHRKVLQKIADKKVNELKIVAQEERHSFDFYQKTFSKETDVETLPSIVESFENKNLDDYEIGNALSDQWSTLKSQWVANLATELEKLPERVMSIIQLQPNEVNRAVAIFEAINRGGEPLSVYDLVVAKSARDKNRRNLSAKIIESVEKPISIAPTLNSQYVSEQNGIDKADWQPSVMKIAKNNELSRPFQDWFVNVLSLLANVKEKDQRFSIEFIKREKILKLSSEEINKLTDRTINAIVRALAFLLFRCGVTDAKDISYKLMLVVLAFYLDDDEVWNNKAKLDKLERWYWIALLGGGYFTRQNEKCINDLIELEKYLSGNPEEKISGKADNVLNYQGYATRNILLRKDSDEVEQKSVRNGILQFILSGCPCDFNILNPTQKNITPWGIASGDIDVELHHIIPLGNVTKIGESAAKLRPEKKHPLNSPLNFAYISKEANRLISDRSPSEYLDYLNSTTIATHDIPSIEYFQEALKNASYDDVLERRFDLIKSSIEKRIHQLK